MTRLASLQQLAVDIERVIQIARLLYEKNLTMDGFELQLNFTQLFGLLTDIKIQVSEFQTILLEKDKALTELKTAFDSNSHLVCVRDAYYQCNKRGQASGEAYCVKCWENQQQRRKLILKTDDTTVKLCVSCGQHYARSETEHLRPWRLF